MKKIVFVFFALMAGVCAGAQNKNHSNPSDCWGVTVGLNSSKGVKSEFNDRVGLEQFGVTYRHRESLGFVIQPSLMYQVKGGEMKNLDSSLSMRYAEIPVSLQWGPDLLMFRPYVELVPFIGYALSGKCLGEDIDMSNTQMFNRFEYGFGIGGGIDFKQFQFNIRGNWNRDSFLQRTNAYFHTTTFSLTYFFR